MTESTNNISFVPLNSGRAYIGTYDSVSEYASAVISLFSTTACEIFMYQSQNKTGTYVSTYTSSANTQFTQNVALTAPYVYFVVRNSTGTNQTSLSFTVLYKNTYVPPEALVSDVNIVSQSAGLALNSTLVDIDTKLGAGLNVNVQNTSINTVNVNGNTCVIFFDGVLGVGKESAMYFAVGSAGYKQISFFGNVSALAGGGTTPLNLTIAYSQDGSTCYDSSLGQINFTAVGDFSRDWQTSAAYVAIYADSEATATLYYGVSA
jgi:hypothetical protein